MVSEPSRNNIKIFFLALLVNQYRGLDIHCGCFSTRPDPASVPPTAWYLFRDPIFLLAAGYLMFKSFLTPRDESELEESKLAMDGG